MCDCAVGSHCNNISAAFDSFLWQKRPVIYCSIRQNKCIIKSDVQNSQIVIYAQLSKIISGRMTLKFREGRYRLEIEDMNLYVSPDMVKFVKPRPIEYSPRYIIERGERSQKWLLADLYETLKGIKEKLEGNNTEDNW